MMASCVWYLCELVFYMAPNNPDALNRHLCDHFGQQNDDTDFIQNGRCKMTSFNIHGISIPCPFGSDSNFMNCHWNKNSIQMVIVIRLLKIMKCSKTYTIHFFFQRTMDPIHALSFIRTPLKMKMDESGLTNKNLLNMCLVYVCTNPSYSSLFYLFSAFEKC